MLYLPFLLRETPDQFFERPEHIQPRIVVTGVDFTGYDTLVDEKCIFRVRVRSCNSTTLCFQCCLFEKNRSNDDIISTAVPRNP